MATDVFDQFNCFWIGLEALNPVLRKKLSIKDDPATCPKCGHKWAATPTVSGIRTFIQRKLEEESRLYRHIHDIRNGIMHSTKDLRELQDLVSRCTPKTAEALFRAVCFLLEFEEWETMTHGAILKEFPTRGELQGVLIGGDPPSLGPEGEDPHFEIDHQLTGSSVMVNGTVSYQGDTSFKVHLNPEAKLERGVVRLYGDSETTGKIMRISLIRASGKKIHISTKEDQQAAQSN